MHRDAVQGLDARQVRRRGEVAIYLHAGPPWGQQQVDGDDGGGAAAQLLHKRLLWGQSVPIVWFRLVGWLVGWLVELVCMVDSDDGGAAAAQLLHKGV